MQDGHATMQDREEAELRSQDLINLGRNLHMVTGAHQKWKEKTTGKYHGQQKQLDMDGLNAQWGK